MRGNTGWLGVLLAVALASCNGEDQAIAGLFDVGGGRQLYLDCEGQGSPTVVMEAGGAGHSGSWRFVQPEVAETTQVCTYDRSGTGRSSSVPPHATIAAIAQELHSLLAAAGVRPPYVLVGHSLGGIIVRQFATQYPDKIAGLVLVDTSHGDQRARFQSAVTPNEWQQYGSPSQDPSFVFPEGTDLRGPDLSSVPLAVLSAGKVRSDVPPDVAGRLDRVRREMHQELLRLSSNSTHVIVADSDHGIPRNRPDIVVDAISKVLEEIRHQEAP